MTARLREDAGSAMIAVLGYVIVISLLLGVAAVEGVRMASFSRKSQDFHAAVEAATAGVQDYLARVNEDPGYSRYAHVAALGCASPSATVGPDAQNPYMGSAFSPLPGGVGGTQVKYQIDASGLCREGVVKVSVQGRSQQVVRAVTFTLRRRSFVDYTYFSDFEALDPAKYGSNPFSASGDTVEHVCRRHHYEPSAADPTMPTPVWPALRPEAALNQSPGCATINWVTGDQVSGPLHTNDAIMVCGEPLFDGRVTTSWAGDATGRRHLRNPGCVNKPNFKDNADQDFCTFAVSGTDACYAPPLQMPAANDALEAVSGACVYNGPTVIKLRGNVMDVTSPNTPPAVGCGPGTGIAYPSSGVVYVRDVPGTRTPVACGTPTGYLSPQNPVGFPQYAGDITRYDCTAGDVFVRGSNSGGLTIGAERRIVVNGDLTNTSLSSAPDAMLGLVSNTGVEVYHPVDASGTNLAPVPVRLVSASMLSVNGSVSVQHYDQGAPLGTLKITGGMAQRWRGLVGTTDGLHGYLKDYNWDVRLQFRSPPYFLEPVEAAWQIIRTQQ